jgi:hypothetical protein
MLSPKSPYYKFKMQDNTKTQKQIKEKKEKKNTNKEIEQFFYKKRARNMPGLHYCV